MIFVTMFSILMCLMSIPGIIFILLREVRFKNLRLFLVLHGIKRVNPILYLANTMTWGNYSQCQARSIALVRHCIKQKYNITQISKNTDTHIISLYGRFYAPYLLLFVQIDNNITFYLNTEDMVGFLSMINYDNSTTFTTYEELLEEIFVNNCNNIDINKLKAFHNKYL